MFRRILVPVDLTEKNRRAVGVALGLVPPDDEEARVTLLHVIETLDLPFDELEEFYRQLEEKARDAMDRLAEPIREAGMVPLEQVVYGERGRAIVEHADVEDYDLIVLSSRRYDPEDPSANWATLSHKVAILSRSPVLLVKGER